MLVGSAPQKHPSPYTERLGGKIFLCRGQLDEIAKRGQSVVIKKRGSYASYCSKILWKFILERFPYLIGNLPYTCQFWSTAKILLDAILLEFPS